MTMDTGHLLWRAAEHYRDRTALEEPGRDLTFAQLSDRVSKLGRALRALGLRDGDRVLDLQGNSISAVESDLAIRSAGLVRVALNYRMHEDDWSLIAEDSGSTTLIYDASFADRTDSLRAGVKNMIVIGDGPGEDLDVLLEQQMAGRLPAVAADQLSGLHYSSGTTGIPKGAQRTHRNWWSSVTNMTHGVLRRTPGVVDAFIHAGPITHTSGLFILPFLASGSRQIILPSWDAETFIDAVRTRGGTHTALVPTMISRLLAHHDATPETFASLDMLAYAGAPMPVEQIRQAHDRLTPNLVQYYGLVEAIPPVTILDAEDHAHALAGDIDLLSSAGRPALTVELDVVDADGRSVPHGEIGEVVTRGDHVMPGYENAQGRDDLAKSIRDGWLHTGDLGRRGASGHLWLVDRRADMIISGGYNIYPREVEEVMAAVQGVDEVAVLGIADPDWGQRVVAFYTVSAGRTVDDQMLAEHCRSRMAGYKKPKEFRRLDAFPVNMNGKIAKKQLRAALEGTP